MSDPALATRSPESDAMEDVPTTTPTNTSQPPFTTVPSAISSTDSSAQSGPAMGEHCTSDRPLPSNLTTHTPSGTITTLNDIKTYISKPADYPSTPAKLLLLLTNGTGIHSLNNQLQADQFAASGYLVIMPDQFGGDPAPNNTNRVTSPTGGLAEYQNLPTTTQDTEQQQTPQSPSLLDRIKLTFVDTAKSFVLDMWLARQTPEKVLPRLLSVVSAIQDEYADAIAHGGGIYGVGYCFGAKYTLILARGEEYGGPAGHPSIGGKGIDLGELTASLPKMPEMKLPALPSSVAGVFGGGGAAKAEGEDVEANTQTTTTAPEPTQQPTVQEHGPNPTESSPALPHAAFTKPLLKTAAIAHGTLITRQDLTELSPHVPTLIVAVQNDPLFPEEVLDVGRKHWGASNAEVKIEVFGKGVPHGFAVLGEYEDEGIRKEQGRAGGLVLGWLDSH